MRIDCVNFLHDIEDKPSVISKQIDPLQYYCCSHIALDHDDKEPLSSANQTIVSRFVKEAFCAQFLLAENKAKEKKNGPTTGAPLDKESIKKIATSICQQVSYFLQQHNWSLHLHLLAFIASPSDPEKVLLLQVGHPSIMGYDEQKKEVFFLQGARLDTHEPNHYSTTLGAISQASAGEVVLDYVPLDSIGKKRLLVGAPELQFLQSQTLRSIFRDDWDLLDQTLIETLQNQNLSHLSPFSCIELSRGGRLRQIYAHLNKALNSISKPSSPTQSNS